MCHLPETGSSFMVGSERKSLQPVDNGQTSDDTVRLDFQFF